MKPRPPDPRKLDVAKAAAEALVLEGHWPLAGFERLQDRSVAAATDADVRWSARGQHRAVAGSEPEIWLHVFAQARVWRECQRCLQPVVLDLEVARGLRFVADEATAEALDGESEDDVLALPRRLDLHALVEDELLLALPIVPMHPKCLRPLPVSAGDAPDEDRPVAKSPFAVLAGLRRERKN